MNEQQQTVTTGQACWELPSVQGQMAWNSVGKAAKPRCYITSLNTGHAHGLLWLINVQRFYYHFKPCIHILGGGVLFLSTKITKSAVDLVD